MPRPLSKEISVTEPGPHHQKALDRFLSEHPDVAQSLETLNPLAARAIGQSMKEYRQERLNEAFEAEAERLGLFAWELTLKLTTESAEAFEAQRLEVHKEVAQMAGLSWTEYCQLHDLSGFFHSFCSRHRCRRSAACRPACPVDCPG